MQKQIIAWLLKGRVVKVKFNNVSDFVYMPLLLNIFCFLREFPSPLRNYRMPP